MVARTDRLPSARKTYIANKLANAKYLEQEIAEMADDPDIQVEIAAIDREFIVTEMDGLEAL